MKALLIAEYEQIIKDKRYFAYIICFLMSFIGGIISYVNHVQPNSYSLLLYSYVVINNYSKNHFIKSNSIRLLPIKPQSFLLIVFLELCINNLILAICWLIFCAMAGNFYIPEMFWLELILVFECMFIPNVFLSYKWPKHYLEHIFIILTVAGIYWIVVTKTMINHEASFLIFLVVLFVATYISSIRILKTNNNF